MKRIVGTLSFITLFVMPMISNAATPAPDITIAAFQYLPSGHFSVDPLNLTNGAGTVALPAEPTTFTKGQTIKIMNLDAALPAPHTLTEITGPTSTSFSVTVQPGGTASLKLPTKTGTYVYECLIHRGMRGSFAIA